MEEIAATFGGVGLPPELMMGAAALYRLVGVARLGEETRGTHLQARSASDITEQLAAHVSQKESRV
jgi:hypothetical protein